MNSSIQKTLPQMIVDPNTLKADYQYQRPLDERRVDYIVEHFEPGLFRDPICSIRSNGDIYILDGNHSIASAKRLGWKKLKVSYHTGLTIAQEALEFDKLNKGGKEGRLPVSVSGRFKSRLFGGSPVEIEISKIADGLGLKLCGQGKNSVGAIEAIYWAHTNRNLAKTLWTLKSWYPEGGKVYGNDLIRCVSAFYQAHPNADPKRLAKSLEKLLPDELRVRLVRAKKTYGQLGVTYVGQISTLVDLYNSGLHRSQRLA